MNRSISYAAILGGLFLAGCSPTVKIEAPDKPIVINMTIEHRLIVTKELEKAETENPEIFE